MDNITLNGDGSYHLTGTQLNGMSEGASYGNELQMSSNYPIVRLTGSTGYLGNRESSFDMPHSTNTDPRWDSTRTRCRQSEQRPASRSRVPRSRLDIGLLHPRRRVERDEG